MNDDANFRNLSGLATFLKASLWAFAAIVAINIWSGWLEIALLQRIANGDVITETDAAANDSRQSFCGILYIAIYLITAVLFLRWTYLSNRNARCLNADAMKTSPGWAVGWYFIPIASLWKPYQALKEIFVASRPEFAIELNEPSRPAIMPLWWTLWILSGFLGQSTYRLADRAETIEGLLASSWVKLFSDVLDLPLAIVVISLVSTLQSWQSEKLRSVPSVATSIG